MKCQKEALNRKSEEKQNCLLPRENQHTNMTILVRHSLTHETRFSFSALWWSARRRLWIKKVKRSKLVCYPKKTQLGPLLQSRDHLRMLKAYSVKLWFQRWSGVLVFHALPPAERPGRTRCLSWLMRDALPGPEWVEYWDKLWARYDTCSVMMFLATAVLDYNVNK